MICLELNWFVYDPSWMLHLVFVWILRSSVLVVFNNFLLIDATDRSKISSILKRLFFDVSLYPLSFFANTSLIWLFLFSFFFLFLENEIMPLFPFFLENANRPILRFLLLWPFLNKEYLLKTNYYYKKIASFSIYISSELLRFAKNEIGYRQKLSALDHY